jgi:hypothetical protein
MKLRSLKIIIILFLCVNVHLYADDWRQGTIVLKGNRTLKGEIAVKFDYDVVLFRLADEVMVVPAHKIDSFYIFDSEGDNGSQFVSIELTIGAARYHQFFELLIAGDVSLLRRQHLVWYSIHFDEVEYDYFVKRENEITTLRKFKRHVYPQMVKSSQALSSFVSDNRLSLTKSADVVRIIDHFNQLQANNNPLAKN